MRKVNVVVLAVAIAPLNSGTGDVLHGTVKPGLIQGLDNSVRMERVKGHHLAVAADGDRGVQQMVRLIGHEIRPVDEDQGLGDPGLGHAAAGAVDRSTLAMIIAPAGHGRSAQRTTVTP
jgi:hypothetical protein